MCPASASSSNNWPRPPGEIQIEAIRSGGPGGQNVNKVASAVQLRFDVRASALPEVVKERILRLPDRRLTDAGVLVIRAAEHRSQEQNRTAALARLREVIQSAAAVRRTRKPTRPSRAARQRRADQKRRRSQVKRMRGPITE